MKTKGLAKKLSLIIIFMAGENIAGAHSQSGGLGKSTTGAVATDKYTVTCSNDGGGEPNKLYFHVKDNAPVVIPKISVQAKKAGAVTALSIDVIDGDAAYSPVRNLAKGAGDYELTITKAAAAKTCVATAKAKCKGIDTYTLEFHCETAEGFHTGTDLYMTQNQ